MRTANKILLSILLLSSFGLTGCLGEGDLDCTLPEQDLTLQFLHNINPSYENTISDIIEYIDLYIYNETGELVRNERLLKDDLEATDYLYSTRLQGGVYTLIAIMNNGDQYFCEQTENFANAGVRIKCNGEQIIAENTSPIYYGYDDKLYDNQYKEKQAVVNLAWYPVHKTINFANNTNNIKIETRFNRYLTRDSQLEVTITGRNGIFDFVNTCPNSHPVYTYLPYNKETSNELTYQSYTSNLTTQRLWSEDDLELTIIKKEPGKPDEVMASQPLTPLIMKNPLYNNDYQLERYNDYRIVYEFEYRDTWVLTEVIVNDWKTIQQIEDL